MNKSKFKINEKVTYLNPYSRIKSEGTIILIAEIQECVTSGLVGEKLYYFSEGQQYNPIMLFEKDLEKISEHE